MRQFIRTVTYVLLSSFPLLALPAVPQRHDLVGAYYYPWYFPGKWQDLKAQLTPSLGYYNTDSVPIVTQHIDSAAYYGVDFFLMSWWKKDDVTDTHLRNGFLKAPNRNKIKFAMEVEPLGELDTLDGKRDGVVDFDSAAVLKAWIGIFQYFHDNFFNDPSYLRIGGRPVVLVYVTRTFAHFGSQYVDSVKAHVGDVYIMADEAFIGAQSDPATARNGWRNRNSVFESYVSYNSYEATLINPGDSAITYQRRVAMPYYQNWASKTVFHPPIMPYYQDFRAGHPPLPGSTDQFRDIIKDIRALPNWAPASDSVTRAYLVTSWNEWFEGTSIENSVENGDRYCKILREAFVEHGSQSRPELTQIAGQTTLRIKSNYRNAYLCDEPAGAGDLGARAACDAKRQSFILVNLGNDDVALKDPVTNKYLSVWSDSTVYPLQNFIGTWEIFHLVRQGADIRLQSKKNGAWLRPTADSSGMVRADAATPTSDVLLHIDSSAVALGRAGLAQPSAPFSGFTLAREGAAGWRMQVSDAAIRSVSVRDLRGGNVSVTLVPGPGAYVLPSRSGVSVLEVETRQGRQSYLLPPAR